MSQSEFDTTGKVEFYNNTGQYGFIQVNNENEDIFFHIDDIQLSEDDLKNCEGKTVHISYEESETRTGTELRVTKMKFV